MTQLDTRQAKPLRAVARGRGRRRLGVRRCTLLSLEDIVEMVGAPDRPAWMSIGAERSPSGDGSATVRLAWHLDQDRDSVRMTVPECRALAAAILVTCAELE
jgi:hypothetical protein